MDLYHADIRLPDGFRMPTARVGLAWTNHARHAALTDRYGRIDCWDDLDMSACRPIEVGVEHGRVVKVVVRTTYNDDIDVVFVLIPNGRNPWRVKTVWLNMSDDTHRTLDRSRYIA